MILVVSGRLLSKSFALTDHRWQTKLLEMMLDQHGGFGFTFIVHRKLVPGALAPVKNDWVRLRSACTQQRCISRNIGRFDVEQFELRSAIE